MKQITDTFARMVLSNPQKSVIECYNWFIEKIDESKLDIVRENYPLIIKTGEAIRSAPKEIQNKILGI